MLPVFSNLAKTILSTSLTCHISMAAGLVENNVVKATETMEVTSPMYGSKKHTEPSGLQNNITQLHSASAIFYPIHQTMAESMYAFCPINQHTVNTPSHI